LSEKTIRISRQKKRRGDQPGKKVCLKKEKKKKEKRKAKVL
jgi:hypothetical protein